MIAIDATPLTEPGHGGVRRALATLLAGIAALGDRPPVHLIAPGPLSPSGLVVPLDGVHQPACGRLTPARFRRRFLPRTLDRLGARVLYVPFAATPCVSIPVVALVHELPHARWGNLEGRVRRWRFARATRAAAVRASRLLVPTRATANDLIQETGVAAGRVHVTGNAFDPRPWAKARPTTAGIDVVAVGSGVRAGGARKKGMDVLAQAAAAHPERAFHVVGRPTPGMPPNVTFHPPLDDAALSGLVASARVLVHPARSEGFGYPPLEAMAAGVPVVATRGGALEEILGDAAVLVAPGDADALARGLRCALEEDSLRATLRERGRRRARSFDPATVARRVVDILEEVAA